MCSIRVLQKCNFSSILSNQNQHYSHFGTDLRGSTLLRPTRTNCIIIIIVISATLAKLVIKGWKLYSSIKGVGFALLKIEQLRFA